jgi:hypothetical protein
MINMSQGLNKLRSPMPEGGQSYDKYVPSIHIVKLCYSEE